MTTSKKQTEALIMAGLNLIQPALSIYDQDLQLAACNHRFKDMFNLPDNLITPGAHFSDCIRHLASTGEYGIVSDIETFVQDRVEIARAFVPHYMERTRANGRTITVEGSPLPQGGWVTVYTDITTTKRQEALMRTRSEELNDQVLLDAEELARTNRKLEATVAALKEAQRELTAMEAHTRLTAEMMPAHIAHIDRDQRYTYSNQQLTAVMPRRPSDIIGRHIADTLGSEAYGQIETYLNEAFQGKDSVFEFNDKISSRRIRTALTPDKNSKGINGVYVLSMDVTEETQARVALQQTHKREMAAQLTNGLAHDFANLLTIILGMQGKLQKMPLPDDADALITATLSAARRGGTLLNRIAGMTGHRSLQLLPTDLDDFLTELQTLASPLLSDGLTLTIKNHCKKSSFLIDPGMLRDSLLNLILNARDASPSSGAITVQCYTVENTWLEFSVQDGGNGFSPNALQNALNPFFTTKGGEGSGLGLSMVYDMTKLAGGEVLLSNSFQGAHVTLRLPLRTAAPSRQPGLVLLVEDNLDLRSSMRDMLTELGHSVVEASSVAEAMALWDGLPDIALILSDLVLQGEETGLDLGGHAQRTQTPVHFMTSLPPSHDLYQQATQIAPVIPKPFGAEDLSRFLNSKDVP